MKISSRRPIGLWIVSGVRVVSAPSIPQGGKIAGHFQVYFPEEIRRLGVTQAPKSKLPPLIEELSERELEVVTAVARGLTNQGIGSSLGISVETVKTHVVNAKDKLGAADRTQLAVMALLYGLIDPLG